jgi:hypothetical protein
VEPLDRGAPAPGAPRARPAGVRAVVRVQLQKLMRVTNA